MIRDESLGAFGMVTRRIVLTGRPTHDRILAMAVFDASVSNTP